MLFVAVVVSGLEIDTIIRIIFVGAQSCCRGSVCRTLDVGLRLVNYRKEAIYGEETTRHVKHWHANRYNG